MSQQLRQHLANFLGSYPSSPYVVASLLVVLLLSLSAMGFFSLSSHFKPAGKVSSTSSVQGRSNAVELALLHRRGIRRPGSRPRVSAHSGRCTRLHRLPQRNQARSRSCHSRSAFLFSWLHAQLTPRAQTHRVSPSQKLASYSCDLTSSSSAASTLQAVCAPFGRAPDVIFACAGGAVPGIDRKSVV